LPDERRIEKPGERHHTAEHGQQRAVELRARRERGGELGAGDEAAELEILRRLVIFGEAAWNALQFVTFERADEPPEAARLDDRAQLLRFDAMCSRIACSCGGCGE